jgi:hypothetical protein
MRNPVFSLDSPVKPENDFFEFQYPAACCTVGYLEKINNLQFSQRREQRSQVTEDETNSATK